MLNLQDKDLEKYLRERKQGKRRGAVSKCIVSANGMKDAFDLCRTLSLEDMADLTNANDWDIEMLNNKDYFPEYFYKKNEVKIYGYYNTENNKFTALANLGKPELHPAEVLGRTQWLPINMKELFFFDDLENRLREVQKEYSHLLDEMQKTIEEENVYPILLVDEGKTASECYIGWSYREGIYVRVEGYKSWRQHFYVRNLYKPQLLVRHKYKVFVPTRSLIDGMGLEIRPHFWNYPERDGAWEQRPERKAILFEKFTMARKDVCDVISLHNSGIEWVNKNRRIDLKKEFFDEFNRLEEYLDLLEDYYKRFEDITPSMVLIACKIEKIVRLLETSNLVCKE